MQAYGKEVTVERILQAFKKHNIQPIFGKWWQWFKHGKGCCPISILIVDKTGNTEFVEKMQRKMSDAAIRCIVTEIGADFNAVSSFVSGFDDLCAYIDQPTPGDKEAHELGCQVREALCSSN